MELSYFKAHICFIKIDVSVINFRTNNFRNRSNLFRSLSEFTVIYMSRSRNDHVKKPKHFYINKSYVYLLDGKHATGMNFVHTFYSIEQQSSPHYSLCVWYLYIDRFDFISFILHNFKFNKQLITNLNELTLKWEAYQAGLEVGHRARSRAITHTHTIINEHSISNVNIWINHHGNLIESINRMYTITTIPIFVSY